MEICLYDAFLELKIVKKWVLWEWVSFFAWDVGVIFLGIPSFKILRFWKSFFLKIQIIQVVSLHTYF